MLNDHINEYGSMYDITNITIGDLVKRHNEISNLKFQVNDFAYIKDAVDKISKLLGYLDARDAVSRAPVTVTYDINPYAGYAPPAPRSDKLLHIDRIGNVWINGIIENNPTKIGNEIIKQANSYKDNLPIADFAQYFKPDPKLFDTDLPF